MESTLEIIPAAESVKIEVMPRADLPAIWDGFRNQVSLIKRTAETLEVTEADQKSQMAIARQTRLALRQIRVAVEHKRVELTEDLTRRKGEIDSAARELKRIIEPLEDRLAEQEKFAERLEAKRKEDLKTARLEKLAPYQVSTGFYDLANMPELDFEQLVENLESARVAKIEAEKKVEADRIAAEAARALREKEAAEERARIEAENARLKAEAIAAEKAAAAERAETDRARKEAEAKAREEREAVEAKARAEREAAAAAAEKERQRVETEKRAAAETARKEREAIEAKAREEKAAAEAVARREREAREKIEREVKAAQLAEKARQDAEAKRQRDATKAPDKNKLSGFAEMVRQMPLPELRTLEGSAAALEIVKEISKLADFIAAKANAL